MAISISSINLTGCSYELAYDLLSQSVSDNTSTVRLYGILHVTNNYINWSSGKASVHTSGWQQIGTYYNRGNHIVITRDFIMPHDSNGEFSMWISASLETTYGGANGTTGGILTLPKIDRFAIMIDATNFNDENNPSFTYSNPRDLTLSAWLEVNPNGEHLAIRTIENTGTSGTYTWELTTEERNQLRAKIPNNNSAVCRIGIYSTISGTTQASYKDKTFSIVNGNPTFSNFSVADVNPTTVALTGSTTDNVININGYSNIQATITTNDIAEAIKSASMNKYRFKIGDSSVDIPYSSTSNVSGTLNGATTGVYEVWAIDSRGNSTLATKQATSIINYNKVYIDKQSCSFIRDDNQVGENAILTLRGTFWNDDFGQVNNSLSVSYRLKKTTSSTWITGTTTITPTTSNNDFTFTGQIASDNVDTTWDLDASYNLEVTISDELSTATIELVLNSAIPTMCLDKDGVGILCAYDSSKGGGLQIKGEPIPEQQYTTDGELTYIKNGHIVNVSGAVVMNATSKTFSLAYKPKYNSQFPATGVYSTYDSIASYGNISITANSTTAQLYMNTATTRALINITYYTDD